MGSSSNKAPPKLLRGSHEDAGEDRGRVLVIELVVEPVVVPVPLAVVPVEVTNVAVAVRIAISREDAAQDTTLRILSGLNRIRDL